MNVESLGDDTGTTDGAGRESLDAAGSDGAL